MQQKTNNLNPNQPATQHKKWSPCLRLPTPPQIYRSFLALSQPSVLNNFLHGEIPNFPDPLCENLGRI